MKIEKFVIGIDYGTDSVRAIIVKTDTDKRLRLLYLVIPDGEMDCIVMLLYSNFASILLIILKDYLL